MPEAAPRLLMEPQQPHDAIIFAVYNEAVGPDTEVSTRLLPTKQSISEERQAFYDSGCSVSPNLRPRESDFKVLDTEEAKLRQFKHRIPELVEPSDLQWAYRWRVNERLAKIGIVRAATEGNMHRFDRYNNFVYGHPDKDLFGAAADWYSDAAETALQTGPHHAWKAAETTLEVLGEHRTNRADLAPSEETFQAVRALHFQPMGYYPLLLSGIEMPESNTIDQATGDPILQQVIANLGSDYTLADASGKTWSLSHNLAQAKRPAGYKLPLERFVGLPIGHEIGHHLGERQNALQSSLHLGITGHDRAERGGEGHGVIREQVAYKSFAEFAKTERWQTIVRRHMATCLALGMATGRQSFPDTYAVINAIDRVYEAAKNDGVADDVAMAKADRRSWNLLESIYKGTDGTVPYRRYMIYLEGSTDYWQLDPAVIAQMSRGKRDLTNQRHAAVARKYGISQ